ncbi:hypothetical protein CYLTODRAFT_421778 [Cylindrobasidium torrendii FP15055 ss-10]|uniref:Mid2 domain-containing protein n=1 Tax=Cylindrobasidium torrendii FP15055 ss-10 TaxID=1314674 RepID=A0A0D7BDQ2_9AGAR|nr:hypothetical protein CYLTODRAFT_421778 [Cylindrobasidium torrendii FP15055 ss-10]
MFSSSSSRLALALLAVLAPSCEAQTAKIFQWAFSSSSVSSTLGSCQSLDIKVTNWPKYTGNSSGVPPYYMRAFEKGGGMKTQMIGDDANSLHWTVTSPPGSQLILNVIDSNDSSGGVSPKPFTVETGSTENCVQDQAQDSFTIYSNSSSDAGLPPCAPWGLRIKGGVSPFNISFAQVNSAYITNVTTNQDDDAYTYINRADGGKLLIASAVDSTGRVAYGNPYITTTGETDTDCGSLVSSSGNSTELDAAAAAERAANKSSNTGVIVGATVGTIVPVLILLGLGFWWWRRRRANQPALDIDPDVHTLQPSPYMAEGPSGSSTVAHYPHLQSFVGKGVNPAHPEQSRDFDPYNMVAHPTTPHTSEGNRSSSVYQLSGYPPSSSAGSTNERPTTWNSNAPLVPNRRAKSQEAAGLDPQRARAGSAPRSPGEIVYQHQDGGVVRELPPPYLDRSRQETGDM